MKHRVVGRKLGRTSAHRLALLRNLSTSLFEKERITTTLMKAKELRPFAERLLTLSKRETLHARRQVLRHIHDGRVVSKMFDTLSARFSQRPGGYTRIVKLGPRRGDNAEMAIIELVDFQPARTEEKEKPEAKRRGRAAKPAEAAEAAPAPEAPKKKRALRKKAAETEAPAEKPARKKAAPAKQAAGRKGASRGK
jgi:large subunit ribosomal protein L17